MNACWRGYIWQAALDLPLRWQSKVQRTTIIRDDTMSTCWMGVVGQLAPNLTGAGIEWKSLDLYWKDVRASFLPCSGVVVPDC
mgnify:CR=1 FL=1